MSDNLKDILKAAKESGATLEQLAKIAEVYSKKKDSSESPSTGEEGTTNTDSTPSAERDYPAPPTFITEKKLPRQDKAPVEYTPSFSDEERNAIYDEAGIPESQRPDRGDGVSIVIEKFALEDAARDRKADKVIDNYENLFKRKQIPFAAGGYGNIRTITPVESEGEQMSEEEASLVKEKTRKEVNSLMGLDESTSYEDASDIVKNDYSYQKSVLAEIALERAKKDRREDVADITATEQVGRGLETIAWAAGLADYPDPEGAGDKIGGFFSAALDPITKKIGANAAIAWYDATNQPLKAEQVDLVKKEGDLENMLQVGLDPDDTRGITETLEEGDSGTAALKFAYYGSQSVGLMAATVLQPEVGIALMATSSGLETYGGFRDRLDLSAEDKATLAISAGATEVLMGKVLGGLGNVRRFRKAIGVSDDIANASLTQRRAAYNKALDFIEPYSKKVKDVLTTPSARAAGRLVYDTGAEAVEEFGVEITNQLFAHAIAGEEFDGYALADAALLGGGMGKAMGSVSAMKAYNVESSFYNKPLRSDLDKYQELQTMYADLKQAAREENVPAKRKVILEEAAKVRSEGQELIRKANQAYNKLNFDERSELSAINKKITGAINDVKEATNKTVKNLKKNELAGLLVRKAEIESKAGLDLQLEDSQQQGLEGVQAREIAAEAAKDVDAVPLKTAMDMIADLEAKRSERLQEAKDRQRTNKDSAEKALNTRVTYLDPATNLTVEGVLTKDGQRLAVETEEGIIDIGLYENFKERSLESLTMQPAQGLLAVNPDGSFTYRPVANKAANTAARGTRMFNRNGVKAIKRNKQGDVAAVRLTNEDGSVTYNLRGEEAEEAAYQILLKETQTPEDIAKVDAALAQEAEDRTIIQAEQQQAAGGRREVQGETRKPVEEPKQPLSLGERMQGNEKLSDEARLVLSKYMIALSSISPNHKVIVHDTQSQVREEWLKANGDPNGNPLAFNDPNIDVIHLHVDLFNNVRRGQNIDVVKHEFVHPILDAVFSKNASARADIARGVLDILNVIPHTNSAKRAVFNHARKYADDAQYTVELITEFFNQFSNDANLQQAIEADASILDKIVKLINKFLSKFTDFRINSKTSTSEVKQLLNQMNKAFSQGLPMDSALIKKKVDEEVSQKLQAYEGLRTAEAKTLAEHLDGVLPQDVIDEMVAGTWKLEEAMGYNTASVLYRTPVIKAENDSVRKLLQDLGAHVETSENVFVLRNFNRSSDASDITSADFIPIEKVQNIKELAGLRLAAKTLGVDVKFINSADVDSSTGYLIPNKENGLTEATIFVNLDSFNSEDSFFGIGAFIVESIRRADTLGGAQVGGAYLAQIENKVIEVEEKLKAGQELVGNEGGMYLDIMREKQAALASFSMGASSIEKRKKVASDAFSYGFAKVLSDELSRFQKDASYILEFNELTTELLDEFNEVINAAAAVEGESPSFRLENITAYSPTQILNAVFIDRILDNVVEEERGQFEQKLLLAAEEAQNSGAAKKYTEYLPAYTYVLSDIGSKTKAEFNYTNFANQSSDKLIEGYEKFNDKIDELLRDELREFKKLNTITLNVWKQHDTGNHYGELQDVPKEEIDFDVQEKTRKLQLDTEIELLEIKERLNSSTVVESNFLSANDFKWFAKTFLNRAMHTGSTSPIIAKKGYVESIEKGLGAIFAHSIVDQLSRNHHTRTDVMSDILGVNPTEYFDILNQGSSHPSYAGLGFLAKSYVDLTKRLTDLDLYNNDSPFDGFGGELRRIDLDGGEYSSSNELWYGSFKSLIDGNEVVDVSIKPAINNGILNHGYYAERSPSIQITLANGNVYATPLAKVFEEITFQSNSSKIHGDDFPLAGTSKNRIGNFFGFVPFARYGTVESYDQLGNIVDFNAYERNPIYPFFRGRDLDDEVFRTYFSDLRMRYDLDFGAINELAYGVHNGSDIIRKIALGFKIANKDSSIVKDDISMYEMINRSIAEIKKIKNAGLSTQQIKAQETADDILSKIRKGVLDAVDIDRHLGYQGTFYETVSNPNAPSDIPDLQYNISIGGGISFSTDQFGYNDIPDSWKSGKIVESKLLTKIDAAVRYSLIFDAARFSPLPKSLTRQLKPDYMRNDGKSEDYIKKYAYGERELKAPDNQYKRRSLYNTWAMRKFGDYIGLSSKRIVFMPESGYKTDDMYFLSTEISDYELMGMDRRSARQAKKIVGEYMQQHMRRIYHDTFDDINYQLSSAGLQVIPYLTEEMRQDLIKKYNMVKPKQGSTSEETIKSYVQEKSILGNNADEIPFSFVLKPSSNADGSLSIPKLTKEQLPVQPYLEGKVDGSDIIEALEDMRDAEREAFKRIEKRDKLFSWDNLTRGWVNRNQNLRDAVRKGMDKYVKSLLTKRNGYVLYADRMFKKYDKKIFGGLSMGQETIVDDIIFLRRVIQIDRNRDAKRGQLESRIGMLKLALNQDLDKDERKTILNGISQLEKELEGAKRIKHPNPDNLKERQGEINLETATQALGAYESRLGVVEFNKLMERADAYFDSQRDILAYALDVGLINQETFDRFASDDYSQRIFLEKFFGDASETAFQGTNLSKDYIQSLKDGSNGMIFSDARTLLSLSLRSIRAKDIQNQIMRAMHNDAKKKGYKNIDFIKELNTKTVNGKTSLQKASKGFVNVFYRVDGELEGFQIKSEMRDSLFNNVKDYVDVPNRAVKWIRRLTGTSILKAFATGTNTAFALTSAIRFVPESVLGRGVYDKYRILPVMAAVATLDILRATGDAIFNKALIEEYMEAGGETLWLSNSGKPKMAYKRKEMSTLKSIGSKFFAAGFEGISWAANKSELAARLALYKRSKDNIQKANPKLPLEQVKSLAVEEAIMLADFATSGTIGKTIDLGSAYFNPAIQGFRGAASYARSNPKKFMEKLGQFYIASTVLQVVAMMSMDDDEWDRISDYQKQMNLMIPIGRDEDGNMRILKLPRAHTFLPVSALATITAQHIVDLARGKEISENRDTKEHAIIDDAKYMFDAALKSIPLPSIPAFGNSMIVLGYNIDPWTGEEVFKGGGNKDLLEWVKGQQDQKVRDIYKYMSLIGYDAGLYDVSPKKLQVAVEKVITSDRNFLVDKIYDISEALFVHGDKLDKLQQKHGMDAKAIEKEKQRDIEALFGVKGRIYTVPEQKYKKSTNVEKAKKKKNTRMFIMQNNVKDSAKEYASKKGIVEAVPKDVVSKIYSMTESPFERKALISYWKYYYRGKLVDNEIVDLMFVQNSEERLAKLEDIVGNISDMDDDDYYGILRNLKIAGMSKDVEFLYLVEQRRKKQK